MVVSHEGIVLDRQTLVDASSIKKRVESTDFLTYLHEDRKPYLDGVIFFKIL